MSKAEFQRDNGLTPDGVAGKKTIKKIRERLGE
jgi:putative peptidoglycan binding domain